MKCIRCGRDSRRSERVGRTCPGCRGRFAFEPREGDRFTDAFFHHAIDAVSSEGRLRFTVDHVYYEVCRRYRRKRRKGLTVWAVLILIGLGPWVAISMEAFPGNLFLPALMGVPLAIAYRPAWSALVPLERGTFDDHWRKWVSAHGEPEKLIRRRAEKDGARRGARAAEPDLEDYSFDRAVLCDRSETADVLLANGFHFENSCAVLSADGYPEQAFEPVRRMLRRNPQLRVAVIHDCTPDGCLTAESIRLDPEWFGRMPEIRVVDAGLRPSQVRGLRGLYLPAEPDDDTARLRDPDREFLGRYRVEAAAVRPEKLLRAAFRGLQRDLPPWTRDPERERSDVSDDGYSSVYYGDDDPEGGDDGGEDGGDDGFG
jgi:hypothetical protein